MAKVQYYVKQLKDVAADVEAFECFQEENADLLREFFELQRKARKGVQAERKSDIKEQYMRDIVVNVLKEADGPMEARKLFTEADGEALYPNIRTFYSALAQYIGNKNETWQRPMTIRKETKVMRYYTEVTPAGTPIGNVFTRKERTITYELEPSAKRVIETLAKRVK